MKTSLRRLHLILALGLPMAVAGQPAPFAEWGYTFDPLAIPASASNVVAISAGYWHNLALRHDGKVVCWDRDGNEQPPVPTDLSNVVAVAGGYLHDVALRADGTVVAWGDDGFSQLQVPAAATNVVAIAAGSYHSLALHRDGTIIAWGGKIGANDYSYGATAVPPEASNIVAIAAGGSVSLALRGDGTVLAWGDNREGQTAPLPATTNVVAMATGGYHCLALQADGTVVAWGYNYSGETNVPADATNIVAVAAGVAHSAAARADGAVVAWGNNYYWQTDVPDSATNVVAITAGAYDTLALRRDPASPLRPRIWQGPVDRTLLVPQAASLCVGALGSLPLSYQWYFMDAPLPAQTNRWLEFAGVQTNQAGRYYVTVSNDFGAVTSSVATLKVLVPVAIQTPPLSQAIIRGDPVTLAVAASGDLPLAYQWQKDGANLADGGGIEGASSATLTISVVQTNDAGSYRVVITNVANSITSSVATLTVLVPSTITSPPASQSVPAGSNVTFAVTAIGTPPLTFQWRFGQTNLPGATNLAVSLTNVQSSDAGAYDVVVSNAYGVVTSAVAMLTVVPSAPWVTSQPQSRVVSRGQTVALSVSARGTEPIGCQWQLNGINLDGATGFSLSLSNVSEAASGQYRAALTSLAGLTFSAEASLAVVPTVVWGQTNFGVGALSAAATNVVGIAVALAGPLAYPALPPPFSSPCLALRADGIVVGWGGAGSGLLPVPATATNIVAVAAAGGYIGPGGGSASPYALALRDDGTVLAWGSNGSGQTNVPAAATNVVAGVRPAAITPSPCAPTPRWSAGADRRGTDPGAGQRESNVVVIAAGAYHSLALRATGWWWAAGRTNEGQITVPASATNVIAITGPAIFTAWPCAPMGQWSGGA